MKNAFLLLLAILLFQACDNIETNDAALQANVHSDFFKAFAATAEMDEDELSVTILGRSNNQEITLHTWERAQLMYELGPGRNNYASFTDANGKVYDTNVDGGSGEIKITERDDNVSIFTGKFNFVAISAENDTISIHNGLFYSVPFIMVNNTP